MITLYGTPPTRAIRVLWVLNELGLDYEMRHVDLLGGEAQGAAFLALNPAGKLPVLVDGDDVLTESSAIQLYLADKYPQAGLIPDTVEARGQMYRWLFFLVSEIEGPLWRMARHAAIYPEDQRLPQDIEIARRECLAMLQILETHLQGRDWIVGERLSVADLNAAYVLDWTQEQQLLDKLPTLTAYRERLYARPTAPSTIEAAFRAMR